ncbi:hypothetical protein [Cellulomonas humilata]|uniref:hypothetical protein n=1 Tax=Cellulomonas humilata TaxID=144055 RepID=UPI0015854878|nr:hypothetical protein [Cellulomonas humilata]
MRLRAGRVRRALRGDDGLAATGIVLTVVIGVLFLLFLIVIPLLSGTEKAGRTQTAADAAALAGAKGARDRAVDEVAAAVWALRPEALSGTRQVWRFSEAVAGGSGFTGAQQYALANNASVDAYHHDAARDRVQVDVRLGEPAPQGGPVLSRAVAQVGVELASCEVAAVREITGYTEPPPVETPTPEPPPPSPTPSPTPTPTPTPPPFVPQPIYSAWEFGFSCDGEHSFDDSDSALDQLVDRARSRLEDLEPRLVS